MNGSPNYGQDKIMLGVAVNGVGSPGSPVNMASPGYGVGSGATPSSMATGPANGPGNYTGGQGQQMPRMPGGPAGTGIPTGMNGQALNQRQILQQKMLLRQQQVQQAQHQRQIALQNYENQFNQLLMMHNPRPKRNYAFVETPNELLKKYEQYRPSFEFHIYENNYKICAPANTRLQQQQKNPELTSDGLILNKSNETLREFLEYVARGRIPYAIMEVLRDCNIQFYEGNLILQVYDHTNTVDVTIRSDTKGQDHSNGSPHKSPNAVTSAGHSGNPGNLGQAGAVSIKMESPKPVTGSPAASNLKNQIGAVGNMKEDAEKSGNTTLTQTPGQSKPGENQNTKLDSNQTYKRPRVYRTLLRPNDLSQYYDLMSYADHSRFSDTVYQQLESELLTLTKRNLDLSVPMNPYEHKDKLEDELFTAPYWDENVKGIIHQHRDESTAARTKGVVHHIPEHEDNEQKTSEYEQLMLIMNERTTTSTGATFAAIVAMNAMQKMKRSNENAEDDDAVGGIENGLKGSNNNSTGSKVAMAAAAAAASLGGTMNSETNQFRRLKFIEQWKINKEKRKQQALANNMLPTAYNARISMTTPQNGGSSNGMPQGGNSTEGTGKGKAAAKGAKGGTKRGGSTAAGDKAPKPKKPRKTKAKTADGDAAPKRKKAPTKKKQPSGSEGGTPNVPQTPGTAGSPS